MSWVYLGCAILFEVAGTTSMKLADGFSKLAPSVGVALFYTLSLGAMVMAFKKIEVSVAYAVWSGVGTALITVVGVYYFQESVTPLKFLCIGMIILGVVGLRLVENGGAP